MAETDLHRQLMTALIEALEDRFAADPNIYVSGNLLLFFEEGNKRKHVSPDVFVVFGVPKRVRDNYLLWDEGRGPSAVIELTSSSTRREDTHTKHALYRDVLRVPEYFLFDPKGDYLNPRFQGFRLSGGEYRPMRLKDGRLQSRQLGLWLVPVGEHLRLMDPETGRLLPTRAEARQTEAQARRAAEEQARAEIQARQAAEAELERLRAELAAARDRPNGG
ncbi:MAG TPA: Uma2 family endonuclease [Gemmataceae bacterium]|nr:Uma2 family endonuclease [Gemmataceae bacterium]